jgi:N-acetylglutamate synthase-like GNAT family acetyltransferase
MSIPRNVDFCAECAGYELHIWELAVLQDRQRSGLGRTLDQQTIAETKSRNLTAVTLTTFRDVLWNEPFYARLEFKTLEGEEVGARLGEILSSEIANGLPGHKRCAMRLSISEASPMLGVTTRRRRSKGFLTARSTSWRK